MTERLPGCSRLAAANLRGTGVVSQDFEVRELTGQLRTGETVSVEARFAGPEGYLLSKAHAARERGEPRDYYDLAYVLLFNRLGGPAQAAAALRRGRFGPRMSETSLLWRELGARFADRNSVGPRSYAQQAHQADPSSDPAQLAQDAIGAIQDFLANLTA